LNKNSKRISLQHCIDLIFKNNFINYCICYAEINFGNELWIQSLQILATLGSSDWISSAACRIKSTFVVWASDGGTAPAIPLACLACPWPAFLSCSLFNVARTSFSQLSRGGGRTMAPERIGRPRSAWFSRRRLQFCGDVCDECECGFELEEKVSLLES